MLSLVQQLFLLLPLLRDPGAEPQLLPRGVFNASFRRLIWEDSFVRQTFPILCKHPPEFEATLGTIFIQFCLCQSQEPKWNIYVLLEQRGSQACQAEIPTQTRTLPVGVSPLVTTFCLALLRGGEETGG